MSLIATPAANRLHIGIFGKRNSGKSSLINALTNQETAIVSDVAGTTADPVYKHMEINGIGPVTFIDTAGFDDSGSLGVLRVQQTEKAMEKTDIALMIWGDIGKSKEEKLWIDKLKAMGTPIIYIINKADILTNAHTFVEELSQDLKQEVLLVSAKTGLGIGNIRKALIENLPANAESPSITGHLCRDGDTVMLVMPQDTQAPKGRLILPQVQTIRELMDKKCIVHCVTADRYREGLATLKEAPKLIITDSQVFKQVYDNKPATSKLTSFSILFAGYKGDLKYFVQGAKVLAKLTNNSKILIAEACTHAPLEEDIGREKIPALIRKKVGNGLQVDVVAGKDFPDDVTPYDLIIHCGGCMFNRKHILSRVTKARSQGVPMTNYGVAIAALNGILDKIDLI